MQVSDLPLEARAVTATKAAAGLARGGPWLDRGKKGGKGRAAGLGGAHPWMPWLLLIYTCIHLFTQQTVANKIK